MAEAARHGSKAGCAVIDSNMGCPAKKDRPRLFSSGADEKRPIKRAPDRSVVTCRQGPVTLTEAVGWDDDML